MTTNILFKDLQKLTGHKLPPLSYNKPILEQILTDSEKADRKYNSEDVATAVKVIMEDRKIPNHLFNEVAVPYLDDISEFQFTLLMLNEFTT